MQIPLKHWQAWAPGISKANDWFQYATDNLTIDTSQKPDVSFLPVMFRRKLSPLSRMIFYTMHMLEQEIGTISCPMVLATRHGELDISLDLIQAEMSESTFSPAKFSMSVHNSPVGFLSIRNGNKMANTAISAGSKTLEMGLYECMAMLENNSQCLLIYADQPIAEVYNQYRDEISFPVCITALLSKEHAPTEISLDDKSFQAEQFIKQLLKASPKDSR